MSEARDLQRKRIRRGKGLIALVAVAGTTAVSSYVAIDAATGQSSTTIPTTTTTTTTDTSSGTFGVSPSVGSGFGSSHASSGGS